MKSNHWRLRMVISWFPTMFTNVPLEEIIQLLVDKAFINDWFNVTHHLDLSKLELLNLFRAAAKDQPAFPVQWPSL